jgi:hypothetical protein
MLFAPPFGLLAPGRAGSKDMSAFADQCIISAFTSKVKDFSKLFLFFLGENLKNCGK